MTTVAQRSARAAFDAARAAFDRLRRATSDEDIAASLTEAWEGTENALKALAGTSALAGLPLVRELRQRNLLSLDEAHALVDFQATAERVKGATYTPTSADVAAAQAAAVKLPEAFEREDGAVTSIGPAPVSAPLGGKYSAAVASPILPPPQSPARSNRLAYVVVAIAGMAIAGAAVFYALRLRGGPGGTADAGDLTRARAAYAAGDRLTAKNAFSAAAGGSPTLAEPHIYLGRISREEGDMATAKAELTRAVELEPQNPLALRELGAFLLATGQLDLARSFYERAIRVNPDDKNALGFMGCTLIRQGRLDVGQRFLQRAGPGAWQTCAQLPPVSPGPSGPR